MCGTAGLLTLSSRILAPASVISFFPIDLFGISILPSGFLDLPSGILAFYSELYFQCAIPENLKYMVLINNKLTVL